MIPLDSFSMKSKPITLINEDAIYHNNTLKLINQDLMKKFTFKNHGIFAKFH